MRNALLIAGALATALATVSPAQAASRQGNAAAELFFLGALAITTGIVIASQSRQQVQACPSPWPSDLPNPPRGTRWQPDAGEYDANGCLRHTHFTAVPASQRQFVTVQQPRQQLPQGCEHPARSTVPPYQIVACY